MQLKNWNDLRYLLAIKRAPTLTAAAKLLGVDDTTVSRRISALQRSTGNQLVHRLANGTMELTACGESILIHAENIENHIELIEGVLGLESQSTAGVVRITSVPVIVNQLFAPNIGSLLAAHPKLEIELVPESRDLNLTQRETDLAIRLARPTTGGTQLKVRKIGELTYSVYVLRNLKSNQASMLPWITYDESLAHLAPDRWMRTSAGKKSETISNLRVHDVETALQATLAGLGRTVLPDAVAARDSRLKRVLIKGLPVPPTRDLWLLAHANQTKLRRIVAVVKWLEDIL